MSQPVRMSNALLLDQLIKCHSWRTENKILNSVSPGEAWERGTPCNGIRDRNLSIGTLRVPIPSGRA